MATKVMKVSEQIGDKGRERAGGHFQDKTYGYNMRVCNSHGPDQLKWTDTVTGLEVTSGADKKK